MMRHSREKESAKAGAVIRTWRALVMRHTMPCVGLVVLAGCFAMVVIPEEQENAAAQADAAGILPTIVLDPGHGGNDGGALGHGVVEKDLTLDIALRAEQMLKTFNFPVVLTRRTDQYVALEDRVAMGNQQKHALFVSLHLNADKMSSIAGVETFYAKKKATPKDDWSWVGIFEEQQETAAPTDTGEILAGFIQTSILMKMDSHNRGIKARDLFVVRNVQGPAVLVEAGFISNQLEAQLLKNNDYRQRLAAAVAEGILSYEKNRPRTPRSAQPLAKVE